MSTVATLDTVLRLNSTAFRSGMVQAASQANKSLTSISKKAGETASVLLSLKRAAATFGSFYLVKEGIGSLIEAQKQLQAIHYTLIAATGSSAKAADAMGFVIEQSNKLGLILPDAAQGFANLSASATAAGVSMKDQQQLFDAYAKSATSLHLSTVQSNRALLALEQMFAKGKIQAQELRLQLGQAIPGAAQRFQNAVMEMTKGTDLAGKSFDQLLQAGELTTSKFLPALVQALQQSGRGWEDASHGLNANLNRVQTAWFNLKSEVSGGLFNDAATAGAGLLADNLSRVASAVMLIGAGGLARIAGGAANTGASKVTRLQQEYQGTRQAAAAEAAYAEKIAATATAEQAAAAAQKEMLVARQANGAQLIAQNRALQFEAQGQAEAAAATLAHQKTTMTLSANLRAAARAERSLAEATAVATEAQARVNAEMALGTGISKRLTAAQGRLAAAETAVAAAQARVAETKAAQVALGGLAATVGRAAKSFGTFALSLVGGPWGLAVAAIAGVGYAIYKVVKQGEDWRTETTKEVESLKQLTESAKAAADEYGRLGSKMTLSQGLDTLGSSQKELSAKKDELAKLQDQLAAAKRDFQDASVSEYGSAGLFFSQRSIDQLTSRIKELEAEMPSATVATGALALKMRIALTPAVDGLKAAVARLKAGGSIMDAVGQLADKRAMDQGIRDLEAAQAKGNAALGAITTLQEKAHKDLLTKGVGRVAQAKAELALGIEGFKKLGADGAGAIADLQAAAAKAMPELAAADARDNAKKTASVINQEAEAYKSLISTINSRIEQDKEAAASTSTLTEAQKLQIKTDEQFKVGKTKLTAADQERVKQLLATAVAQSLVTRATLQQRDADKALRDLDRQLAEQAQQRQLTNARMLEGMGHGADWNAQRAGIESIQDAYRKQRVEADRAYEAAKLQQGASTILDNKHAASLGKITAAEQEAIVAQQKFYDDQKAANADWGTGFSKAIEDFQTQQQNNAAAAAKMVDNLTSGFSDAFVSFVDGTKSAKDAFGSLIDDMYKQALKFLADKTIQAFFDSFSMSGSAQTPGSSAGGWGSLIGNLGVALFGGGGGVGPGTIGAGLATGGPAAPGSIHPVAEQGPEVLQVGGRSYLLMGAQGGNVIPSHQLGGAGKGSVTYITNVNVQPTSTRRTADQTAEAAARTQRLATTRNG